MPTCHCQSGFMSILYDLQSTALRTLYLVLIFQDILKPKSVYQYKSQEESSQPSVSVKSLAVCIKYTLVFQIVTSFIGNLLIWRFRYQWINIVNPLEDVPSFPRFVTNVFFYIFPLFFFFALIDVNLFGELCLGKKT